MTGIGFGRQYIDLIPTFDFWLEQLFGHLHNSEHVLRYQQDVHVAYLWCLQFRFRYHVYLTSGLRKQIVEFILPKKFKITLKIADSECSFSEHYELVADNLEMGWISYDHCAVYGFVVWHWFCRLVELFQS